MQQLVGVVVHKCVCVCLTRICLGSTSVSCTWGSAGCHDSAEGCLAVCRASELFVSRLFLVMLFLARAAVMQPLFVLSAALVLLVRCCV